MGTTFHGGRHSRSATNRTHHWNQGFGLYAPDASEIGLVKDITAGIAVTIARRDYPGFRTTNITVTGEVRARVSLKRTIEGI